MRSIPLGDGCRPAGRARVRTCCRPGRDRSGRPPGDRRGARARPRARALDPGPGRAPRVRAGRSARRPSTGGLRTDDTPGARAGWFVMPRPALPSTPAGGRSRDLPGPARLDRCGSRMRWGASASSARSSTCSPPGLTVLERNWRCREGELDIVARDGTELVFVEVKTRSSLAFGSPAEAVDRRKAARIRQLAAALDGRAPRGRGRRSGSRCASTSCAWSAPAARPVTASPSSTCVGAF